MSKSEDLAATLRAAAAVLDQTPSAAAAIYRDVDGRTLAEIAASLRSSADEIATGSDR